MKSNTLIVSVMASFVALAAAAATEPKSDQGTYRPSQKSFPDNTSPAPVRESMGRTPSGGEQDRASPPPAREAAGKASSVPSKAMDKAQDVRPASIPSKAKNGAEDVPSDAQDDAEGAPTEEEEEVPSDRQDESEGTNTPAQAVGNAKDSHPANVPFQAMHNAGGARPANVNVKGPSPVGEQHAPPQYLRMRRSRVYAARAEISEACGIMRVQASDPAYSGYVSELRDTNGRYTVITDKSQAVSTRIKAHNIVPSNGNGYDVLGATFGAVHDEAGEERFRGNSGNFAMLTGTSKTLYGKGPSSGRSSFNDAVQAEQSIESAVYNMGENGEIHPSWVDKDGVSSPATWGVNDQKQLVFSSNIGEYIADFGGKSAQVFCLY